ncbi:hypothetical protein ACQ4LE_010646 [Meloidogyne hapla]
MEKILFVFLILTTLNFINAFPTSFANLTRAIKKTSGCRRNDFCMSSEECHGGTCVGFHVSKCLCECIPYRRCNSDLECALFVGACNKKTKRCDCDAAFKLAGFKSRKEAYKNFCYKKSCTIATENIECFGMSCGSGVCKCR